MIDLFILLGISTKGQDLYFLAAKSKFHSLLSVSMKYEVTFFNGYLAEFVYH